MQTGSEVDDGVGSQVTLLFSPSTTDRSEEAEADTCSLADLCHAMKAEDPSSVAAVIHPRERGGRTGRGRGPGRGGRQPGDSSSGRGRGRGRGRGGRSSGGRGGGVGSSNRKPSNNTRTKQNTSRRGRNRSSSHCSNDDTAKIDKSSRFAHLFTSGRHSFAISRVFPVIDRLLISSSDDHSNNHSIRIATAVEFEEWWEAVKVSDGRVYISAS